jgi:Leucine-rich repeat (LRR) protein
MNQIVSKNEFSKDDPSTEELRRLTKKFDLSTATTLDLSGREIIHVRNLPNCSRLKYLDLSNNNISFLHFLKGITSIQYLNISQNSISDLAELRHVNELVHLRCEGNVLVDMKNVLPLRDIKNLKYLSLMTADGKLSNPVCEIPAYKDSMKANFKQLVLLDYGIHTDKKLSLEDEEELQEYHKLVKAVETSVKKDFANLENTIVNLDKKFIDKIASKKVTASRMQEQDEQLDNLERQLDQLNNTILKLIN